MGEDHESTADSYRQLGVTQNNMHDYNVALQSQQRALPSRVKLFGKDHESTANSYTCLKITQNAQLEKDKMKKAEKPTC